MPINYVLLEKITVGAAGASSVTFSSIPQTGYTDLVVKMSDRQTFAQPYANWSIQFNGSGGTAYSRRSLVGNGSSASSGSESSASAIQIANSGQGNTATANTFSNWEIYIPNYTSSSNKSVSIDSVAENNGTVAHATLWSGLWADASAINSITIGVAGSGASFMQYSTFYLYGVAKLGTTPVIVPYATGGDIIDTDGTYWYHTFLSSGTFTPQKAITCDYLVVAGGGSGASGTTVSRRGGAGGAGGYRTSIGGSPLSLATQAYTVTVGAGAAASPSVRTPGTQGSNSVFSTITSTGGGFGSTPDGPPGNGGSGGGGGDGAGPTEIGPGLGNTPSTSPSQGNNGGAGQSTNGAGAGTGGGATAAGTTTTDGAGGAGATSSISGTSRTYATGGAVISGGSGVNATANTGNGGSGGAPNNGLAGNGGSGIVIVRYAV